MLCVVVFSTSLFVFLLSISVSTLINHTLSFLMFTVPNVRKEIFTMHFIALFFSSLFFYKWIEQTFTIAIYFHWPHCSLLFAKNLFQSHGTWNISSNFKCTPCEYSACVCMCLPNVLVFVSVFFCAEITIWIVWQYKWQCMLCAYILCECVCVLVYLSFNCFDFVAINAFDSNTIQMIFIFLISKIMLRFFAQNTHALWKLMQTIITTTKNHTTENKRENFLRCHMHLLHMCLFFVSSSNWVYKLAREFV